MLQLLKAIMKKYGKMSVAKQKCSRTLQFMNDYSRESWYILEVHGVLCYSIYRKREINIGQ